MIQKFLLCQLALLKLIYISSHVIIFCWWKLIATLFFSMHIFLIMASLCLKIIHRSFLFVHRKIFLAQILYSWFMIIRLYHFLNTSWKRSLLLRFFDFLIYLSLLGEFVTCILIFMSIRLHHILLRWPCFGRRLCSRRLIIWLDALIIAFFRLKLLFSVAWISLSIYLSLWSLLNIHFILIVVIIQNLIRINNFRAASSTCNLFHFFYCSLIRKSSLIYLIESFNI